METTGPEGRDRWRRLVQKAAIDGDDWLRRLNQLNDVANTRNEDDYHNGQ